MPKHMEIRAAECHFGPTEKLALNVVVGKCKKTCLRRGIVKWPELEEVLKDWVVEHRNSGHCVSTKMLKRARKDQRNQWIQRISNQHLGAKNS